MELSGFGIIGTGNLGTRLSLALKNAGYNAEYVVSRNIDNARILAEKLSCEYSVKPSDIPDSCKVIFICTSDDAIPDVVTSMTNRQTILIHCSGSTSIDIFKGKVNNYGVLYPLQTFTKDVQIDFNEIPILLEASDDKVLTYIESIGNKLSEHIFYVNSKNRLRCHISAVFVANFSNYMQYIGEELIKETGLDPVVLHPLMEEMHKKQVENGTLFSQTGPARRNDKMTLERHYNELAHDPALQKLYIFVSDMITKTFNES